MSENLVINLNRLAKQMLRDLQFAGLSHVPKSNHPIDISWSHPTLAKHSDITDPGVVTRNQPESNEEAGSATSIPKAGMSFRESYEQAKRKPVETQVRSVPVVTSLVQGVQPPNLNPNMASREERIQALEVVSQCVAQCSRCALLAATRSNTVFGVGDPQAKVMFIGEAPGADEDQSGIPFVGKAGQLLTKIVEACGWRREDIYICNILRCRPPNNRQPNETEASNCREYLDQQIAIVDPDYIVCWGASAAQNLLGRKDAISKMRQQFFGFGRAKVLCTFHPSYLLRDPSKKKFVWEDMKFLMSEMGVTPPGA